MSEFNQQSIVGRHKRLLCTMAISALTSGYASSTVAGATFKIDDTKWISVGAGLRSSFSAQENSAGLNNNQWNNNFNLDNIRLYINGQIHKYLKVEFNTDCQTCGNGGEVRVLDAIGKFEVDSMYNLWVGRMLVPAERREMNGPFYSSIYNTFGGGTPFEPADYNVVIKSDGTSAGSYGRDDGATVWGALFNKRLQYAVGFFRGLRGGANVNDNVLYAQRVAYNFWEVEKNPGYYTSGTYYGKGGDIFTIAASNQYQAQGAGTVTDPGNFRGTSVDVLVEKVLPGGGVATFNGEYKNYDISNGYSLASRNAGGGFSMFAGDAYDVSGMYLIPEKIWIGQTQPFIRYVNVAPSTSSSREMYEAGMNYIIDGHNAKVSLSWQYGDLLSKGLNYTSTASGDKVNAMILGFQWQI
ncbi:hypothetical protein KEF85_11575 [Methylomonas paludis]|uniref:Short chain amide porin n=1 Tax=Methylomonas paludis TaxID=1173101 RepID=A0A975MLD8_9GAMM|nr:hypothetical protein [Methylomonas paludis]QWF69991.1 hypothetical protein KEF85_11575 [Methylomonas paludis]